MIYLALGNLIFVIGYLVGKYCAFHEQREIDGFYDYLCNIINPNQMEEYRAMYQSKKRKVTYDAFVN